MSARDFWSISKPLHQTLSKTIGRRHSMWAVYNLLFQDSGKETIEPLSRFVKPCRSVGSCPHWLVPMKRTDNAEMYALRHRWVHSILDSYGLWFRPIDGPSGLQLVTDGCRGSNFAGCISTVNNLTLCVCTPVTLWQWQTETDKPFRHITLDQCV